MKLTVGLLRRRLKYNPKTGIFTHRLNRGGAKIGERAGCLHKPTGYWILSVANQKIRGNIAAWAMHYGVFPKKHLDHKNTKKDDDRIKNLRLADKSTNGANRPKQKNNTSGYKGVFYMKIPDFWLVQIGVRGKVNYIGIYKKKKDAIAAYARAAKKYHGEFARTR